MRVSDFPELPAFLFLDQPWAEESTRLPRVSSNMWASNGVSAERMETSETAPDVTPRPFLRLGVDSC